MRSDIDLFVTSGAISAGKFDFIPKFIKEFGFQNKFKGAKIKPGRPIMLSKFKKNYFSDFLEILYPWLWVLDFLFILWFEGC